jgi:hypothetical protein
MHTARKKKDSADDESGDDTDEESALSGLDRLFLCTDYRDTALKIGRQQVNVNVLASQQATTDYDLTGQVLWPVSVLLAHHVVNLLDEEASSEPGSPPATTVIELGAGGTAVPAFAAARCWQVQLIIATDGNENAVFELLRSNVDRHNSSLGAHDNGDTKRPACPVMALPCRWGSRTHVRNILAVMSGQMSKQESRVVVVAADVVQWPAVVEPLLHTAKALLWNSAEGGRLLLGIVNRATQTYNLFFAVAMRLGFHSRKVDVSAIFDDGTVPTNCLEGGGRVTEIFELTLLQREEPPILLNERTEDDSSSGNNESSVMGSTHDHEPALPC